MNCLDFSIKLNITRCVYCCRMYIFLKQMLYSQNFTYLLLNQNKRLMSQCFLGYYDYFWNTKHCNVTLNTQLIGLKLLRVHWFFISPFHWTKGRILLIFIGLQLRLRYWRNYDVRCSVRQVP